MSMVFIKKDITEVTRGVVIHGCNAQGVMGSGAALAVKKRWPGAYMAYKREFFEEGLEVGTNIWFQATENLFIVNAITQENYGRPVELAYGNNKAVYANIQAIEDCICEVFLAVNDTDLQRKIYIPKIGCGLGGLDWADDVEPVIRKLLGKPEFNDYTIWICDLYQSNINTGQQIKKIRLNNVWTYKENSK